jgi:hypothetical protein
VSKINDFALKAVFVKFRAKFTICDEVNMQIRHSLGYMHLGRGPNFRSSARTVCPGLMVSAAPLRQPKQVNLGKLLECCMIHFNTYVTSLCAGLIRLVRQKLIASLLENRWNIHLVSMLTNTVSLMIVYCSILDVQVVYLTREFAFT